YSTLYLMNCFNISGKRFSSVGFLF
ncbi:hypothetical protein pipiens_007456, partial [Culex pipiens pipiens]